MSSTIESLIPLIESWAAEKDILLDPVSQSDKMVEEAEEVKEAVWHLDQCQDLSESAEDEFDDTLLPAAKEAVELEIGGVLVTLIIQAKIQGLELKDCLEKAWKKIENRQGETRNGVFIKRADLS